MDVRLSPSSASPCCPALALGKILRGIALIRRNDLAGSQLRVGVRRIDDLLQVVVDNGQSREAIARAELPAPACADSYKTWISDPPHSKRA